MLIGKTKARFSTLQFQPENPVSIESKNRAMFERKDCSFQTTNRDFRRRKFYAGAEDWRTIY